MPCLIDSLIGRMVPSDSKAARRHHAKAEMADNESNHSALLMLTILRNNLIHSAGIISGKCDTSQPV